MCDCFRPLIGLPDAPEFNKNIGCETQFEVCVTSVDSPGDNNIEFINGIGFLDDIKYYYTKMMDNDDYDLLVPIEGSPNDISNIELPKLLNDVKYGEKIITNCNNIKKQLSLDIKDNEKNECVNNMMGDWILIDEYSDDMDSFLQKIGLNLIKRKVLNKGTYTLKLNHNVDDDSKVKVRIEPFIGPTQTMYWDLSGNVFIERNNELGIWFNKLEFERFKHEKSDNHNVIAINITRTNDSFPGKIIETRWTQTDSKYSFVKYIRYR